MEFFSFIEKDAWLKVVYWTRLEFTRYLFLLQAVSAFFVLLKAGFPGNFTASEFFTVCEIL